MAALSSDGTGDERRPSASVGAAFVVAAVVIAVVLLKWMGSDGTDNDTIADGWALGTETVAGAPTTIPSTPAAIAVRLGTETSSASEAGDATTSPDGTTPGSAGSRPGSTEGPGTTPGSGPGTSPTTGHTIVSQPPDPTTTPPPTDPPPTDPPPTDPPPTDPPPTDPPTTLTEAPQTSEGTGLLGTLLGSLAGSRPI